MRVLLALTYYRPHVSGLTVYAERLARGLARRGHTVTVLTSRFHPRLLPRERVDGVEVVRVPVRAKVSKGVIMPLFPVYAAALVRRHEIVNIHMPQFEAALLAALGRLHRRGVVVTYHCDLRLPAGWFNRVVEASLGPLNRIAAALAHRLVVNSADYAAASPFLARAAAKLAPIAPPIDVPDPPPEPAERFTRLGPGPRIGFAARFAAEKGVEHLLRALPLVRREFPEVRILFTGAYKDTVGEEAYWARLRPLIAENEAHLVFLELLPAEAMPAFFASCDVVAVTSLNATESFGLVQVEAMLAGTPVVATDLPGVREPVRRTGMGRLVPARNPEALAAALVAVLRNRDAFVRPRETILAHFDPAHTLAAYERVFAEVAPS